MDIQQVRKHLTRFLWGCIATCIIITALHETALVLPGSYAGDTGRQFVAQALMELITVTCLPLSLALFHFTKIKLKLQTLGTVALHRWGLTRLALIGLPMVANTLLYYLFMTVAFAYMALVLALAIVLIYPSEARCRMDVK